MFPRTVPVLLGLLLLSAPLFAPMADAQEMTGRRVAFDAVRFDDTLFASIDTAYRVEFDEKGDLWYTTGAGVVHVEVDERRRTLYTHVEGLPSSLALGLAVTPEKVYVATDLGLGVIDRATGNVTAVPVEEDGLPDAFVQEVAVVDGKVWVGTNFYGVAVWDPVDDSWAVKNTSTKPGFASPVKRIVPAGDHVWVATQGDGVWRYARDQPFESEEAWTVLLKEDGLVSNHVYGVAQRLDNVYFGTDKGLVRWAGLNPQATPDQEWLHYNRTHGLPHDFVTDVDVIPTSQGELDVFASTRSGMWQLHPETGDNAVRSQNFGILGDSIHDSTLGVGGWAIATARGVSLLRDGEWSYYTTGPSMGASSGPGAFFFTSGSVGDSPYLWFGSGSGLSAFDPTGRAGKGAWYHVGEWHYYPGSVINHIDTDRGITWIATNKGTYGFDPDTGRWIEKLATAPSRNLVYGLDAADGEIWIALFGDGLLMQDLDTNTTRGWDARTDPNVPPSFATLTDVRIQGNDVWLGSGDGLVRMSRVSGTVTATYTVGDGLPGNGIVFRTLPDGASVYVGMQDGGVGELDIASGKVKRVWNWTNDPGFPTGEVRSLHREGSRLWAGFGCSDSWRHEAPCTAGLARIDLVTGEWRAYTQMDSALVQSYVNGIMSRDGILYLATASGAARLDIASDTFLPMQLALPPPGEGEDGATGANGTRSPGSPAVVRIVTPRDGIAVTGVVEITGTASRFGGSVDRVEVRIGSGEWQTATGTQEWSLTWDASDVTGQVPVAARAVSDGEPGREVEILVTVVKPPKEPLTLRHDASDTWTAGKAYPLRAIATGDDPLSVTAYYKRPGESTYTPIVLQRDGNNFQGQIPARDVKEGELTYYMDARSGLLSLTSPEDPTRPHRVPVGAPPRLAVGIEGPMRVDVEAGTTVRFDLNLTNTGTDPATFQVQASGLRSAWVTLDESALRVEPNQTIRVPVAVQVPERAIGGLSNFTFVVRDTTGEAEPASTTVGVTIAAVETASTDTPGPDAGAGERRGFFGIPAPGLFPILVALAGVALVLRRWTS